VDASAGVVALTPAKPVNAEGSITEMPRLRTLLLGFACAAMLGAGPSYAADENGAFAARGVGLDRCSDLIEILEQQDQRAVLAISWLDGYLTSINMHRQNLYDIAPWQRSDLLLSMVSNHCENNPEEPIALVAQRLAEFLYPGRLATRSEHVEARAGDETVQIYSAVLRRAQEALIREGHLSGGADGAYGPQTKSAFEAFQAAEGLPQTGLPDQQTLFRLLSAPPE
jgi:Putative peptidoglycan binding domain